MHSCALPHSAVTHLLTGTVVRGITRKEKSLLVLCPQVQAYGPGLEKSGCIVDNLAEFTVDPKNAGKAPLKILAQVGF